MRIVFQRGVEGRKQGIENWNNFSRDWVTWPLFQSTGRGLQKGESTQEACLWLSAFSWVMKSQLQSQKETCLTAPPMTFQPSTSCQSWLASGRDGCSEDKGGCETRATDTMASHLWQHLKLLGLQKGNRHLETEMTNGFSVQLLSMWYWISENWKKKNQQPKNFCLSSVGLSSVLSHYCKI